MIAKSTRASVQRTEYHTIKLLELIHLDISGKVEPVISASAMTIAFLEDLTAKSEVIPIKIKDELPHELIAYKH